MFFNLFKRKPTVHVEFFDADSGKLIAVTDSPVELLPKSFEAETTLDLQNKKWQVTHADPITAEEFGRTRKLRLTVRKVEVKHVDPKTILFSLPTISNEMASVEEGSSKLNRKTLELLEDDWRQIEFVSATLDAVVERNLDAIREIYANQRVESGAFKSLHVREGLSQPLQDNQFSKTDLAQCIGPSAVGLDGISFSSIAGLVSGGFAFSISDVLYVYGTEADGRVNVLGLYRKQGAITEEMTPTLSDMAKNKNLRLVDWCRAAALPADQIGEWCKRD